MDKQTEFKCNGCGKEASVICEKCERTWCQDNLLPGMHQLPCLAKCESEIYCGGDLHEIEKYLELHYMPNKLQEKRISLLEHSNRYLEAKIDDLETESRQLEFLLMDLTENKVELKKAFISFIQEESGPVSGVPFMRSSCAECKKDLNPMRYGWKDFAFCSDNCKEKFLERRFFQTSEPPKKRSKLSSS